MDDAIVYATAKDQEDDVVTGDADLKDRPGVVYVTTLNRGQDGSLFLSQHRLPTCSLPPLCARTQRGWASYAVPYKANATDKNRFAKAVS
jgi:hypothetical protein